MGSPSDEDVHKYAEFLVQVFPETAIDILLDDDICDQKQINKKIDRLCNRLGKRAVVEGLIIDRQFERLREMAAEIRPGGTGGDSSASSTPSVSRHAGINYLAGAGSMSPVSMGSESLALRRQGYPPRRTITVLHNATAYPLLYRESDEGGFFIGEDILDRFRNPPVDYVAPPPRVQLDGLMIDVSQRVALTWSYENDSGSKYNKFWVVRSGLIKHADVLIAPSHVGRPWGQHTSSHAPSGLGPMDRPPSAPNPPAAAASYGYPMPPSSGLHSVPSTSGSRFGQQSDHGGPPNFHRQPPPHHMSQGPRLVPSHAPTMGSMGSPTSSHPSARASAPEKSSAADGGSKSGGTDMVTVTICPQSAPDRASSRAINLNAAAEAVLAKIKSSLRRVPGYDNPDWSELQLSISPLGGGNVNPQDLSLDAEDFEECWESTVKFMRKYRVPELDAEFRFDIV